ncbi:excinuclease ABC subunit UvrB [Lentimicrobium sp.]|uniref:excinuclease ABC subunit UvrB n=1 Tax=Lentimicrobium sp. TaxID=2034841 RepID=UPI0025E5D7AB|nr:excinuclease ABC subunit UvrB [Lentimicrobium sp.]MCO5255432.1 excinuclease ABC subunit UvrB [Lentimicrobium sp.]MCO5261739.1 excinuclease ABC subunit UvrB [Lentimicrobium sp.]HPF63227.1 excinuclease ABC subunit UvrB [Lentimicrobium sp.]HPJ61055.1 excinuclease ABC subunit UvrB [Lentimicrobium sp.]HPR24847.1 excinuclease ABC subunit UvrB [Lentimicrobium sp.]
MDFKLTADFTPTGDQPEAIRQLVEGLRRGDPAQVLLGVTGSGKTFTIANVIKEVNRPALILSHNKTLAAQLYGEFKQFFPDNAVEYFVSYYDYYQPEAFIPTTNTYIEKDLSINDEIEKLRLSATSALLSGRRDVIVVSSVSCIYGIGNPDDFANNVIRLKTGDKISRNKLLWAFVEGLYNRTEAEFNRGNFRVKGDTVDVFPAYADYAIRIIFWDDEIESMESFNPTDGTIIEKLDRINIYPANIFVTSKEKMKDAIEQIQYDMMSQVEYFNETGKSLEARRLEDRVSYDIEMMRELGYCSGIENYSRYFDGRSAGSRPFCLLDYFPDDYITVIDESHVTVSQIRAMYGGDRSRKQTLVEYGFRLPSALDNRPLKFEEFEGMTGQTIYVSATPADFELQKSEGVVVEQLIRPTGLLDPPVEIRPSLNQVDDLLDEIARTIETGGRTLVTTLTKRMAEELTKYLTKLDINCRYIHSDVDTIERVEILRDLRLGNFDVLVGVNLLREGLDLPEVSLVAILDADKEGFLRSERSLTQTAGRAARNINSKVIMYADKTTDSMRRSIDETNRRREKQIAYNIANNITPRQIVKSMTSIIGQTAVASASGKAPKAYIEQEGLSIAADPVVKYMSKEQLEKAVIQARKAMEKAAKELDFIEAARLRDEMFALQEMLKNH